MNEREKHSIRKLLQDRDVLTYLILMITLYSRSSSAHHPSVFPPRALDCRFRRLDFPVVRSGWRLSSSTSALSTFSAPPLHFHQTNICVQLHHSAQRPGSQQHLRIEISVSSHHNHASILHQESSRVRRHQRKRARTLRRPLHDLPGSDQGTGTFRQREHMLIRFPDLEQAMGAGCSRLRWHCRLLQLRLPPGHQETQGQELLRGR